jgi:murein DD-endopeptidase MepM/ murein hydrolase activator NlpD
MKDSARRWILIGSFAIVLIALTAALPLLLHPGQTKLSVTEERTYITPEPTTAEDAVVIDTPVPTPERIVETPIPVYPSGAVDLLVDGVPLFALDNHEIADQLVHRYLELCANENVESRCVLLTAAVDAELSTVPATGAVEYLTTEEAMNRLRRDRTLIPVRCTVERIRVDVKMPDPTIDRHPALPNGSRMFRRFGVANRTLVLTETLYRNGELVSETETLNTSVVAGIPQTVLNGAYRKLMPSGDGIDPTLYRNEGVKGPAAESLQFSAPIRGTLVGCFGLTSEGMRYGVDFSAAPGSPVVAPESGTLVFLGERPGLGFVIEIAHDEGFVSRLSIGADTTEGLVLGMHVNRGDKIAVLPPRENAPDSFLHYELIIDGIPYNPLYWLPKQ